MTNDITELTAEKLDEVRQRYRHTEVPKCHICGAEMTIQRMSASRITYGCTGATYDETGCHYAEGRSIADDHYAESRITVVDVSDPDVLTLVEALEKAQTINAAAEKLVRCKGRYHSEQNYRALAALFGVNTPDQPPLENENIHYVDAAELESFRTAYMVWSDKTDWVRDDRRFDVVKPLGKHLADVLKEYIEHLESRLNEVEESHAQVIQSRDHYKRMTEEGLKQLAESRAVKLPRRSVGEVMHMSGFSRDYAEGWCSGNDNAIHEMRVAGIKWEDA